MSNQIFSEVNPVKFIIVHKPGKEHTFITPKNISEKIEINGKSNDNPDFLLFDDIIQIKKAQNEHNQFVKILNHFTNGNTYDFIDLLNDIIKDNSIKENLLKECIENELKTYDNSINIKDFENINSQQLTETLITGYLNNNKIFSHPVPNLIFTRDIAVLIGKRLLITWNKKEVRNRENILSKYVFSHFIKFNNLKLYDFNKYYPELSIEGGDILILDQERVCIGVSERTPLESIIKINKLIFDEGFKTVFAINLPKKRTYMHLDTVFTLISKNEALIYPPFLSSDNNHKIYIYKNNGYKFISNKNLIETLKIDGLDLKPIYCGGNSSIMQQREQWTDGANSFALEPGKIICYKCNEYTIKELKKNDYEIISDQKYLENYEYYNNSKEKLAITLDSTELVRGRGGPRCLTLPLFRI